MNKNDDKNKETKDMSTLIIINVCGFTILPTSLMSIRANYNSIENGLVLFYILLFSFVTTVVRSDLFNNTMDFLSRIISMISKSLSSIGINGSCWPKLM